MAAPRRLPARCYAAPGGPFVRAQGHLRVMPRAKEGLMKRRQFLALLAGAPVAWPLVGAAQVRPQVARIGILHPGSPPDPWLDGLRDGLRDLGYVEGKD